MSDTTGHSVHSIIGREREIASVSRAVHESAEGRPRFIAIGGAPGIGKTTLAEKACDIADDAGAIICWVRCTDVVPLSPLWAWEQILNQVSAQSDEERNHAIDAIKEYRDHSSSEPNVAQVQKHRFAAFDITRRVVNHACEDSHHVLAIDDLQWADIPSLRLLEFICQQVRKIMLTVVVTFRTAGAPQDHPVYVTLGEIERESGAEQHILNGFSVVETQLFVKRFTGRELTNENVSSLYSHTEGNPFYVVEIARELLAGTEAVFRDSGDEINVRTPPALRGAILARLYKLGNSVADTLAVAANIGRHFPISVLLEVLEDTNDSIEEVIQIAETAGVVVADSTPGIRRFSHDLVRDALRDSIRPIGTNTHWKIARGLERFYGSQAMHHAAELASHFIHATEGDDGALAENCELISACFRYACAAGEQSIGSGDFETAARLFTAATLNERGAEDQNSLAHLYWKLGTVEEHLSRSSAVGWITKAYRIFIGLGDFDAALRCATSPHFATCYLDDEPMELQRDVLRHVCSGLPGATLARCQIALHTLKVDRDYRKYRTTVERELRNVARLGSNPEELEILSALVFIDFFHLQKDEEILARLLDLSEKAGNASAEVSGRINASYFAYYYRNSIDEARSARRHVDAALFRAEQVRDHRWLALALMARGRALFGEGRWDACEKDLERGVKLIPTFERATPSRLRGLMAVERGDEAKFTAIVDSCLSLHPRPEENINAAIEVCWLISLGALLRGVNYRLDAAMDMFGEILNSDGYDDGMIFRALIGYGIAAAVTDDGPTVLSIHNRICTFEASHERTRYSNCWIRGIISAAAGDTERARGLYQSELDFSKATGSWGIWTWAVRFLCELPASNKSRDDSQGIERLGSLAVAHSRDIGMGNTSRRIERTLALLRIAESEKKVPFASGLTKREVEVLRHIALGKTNQEISRGLFISEHTVAHHVSHIFAKIGVDNRTAAAAFAVRSGIAGRKQD